MAISCRSAVPFHSTFMIIMLNVVLFILASIFVLSASSSVICLGHCEKTCTCTQNYTYQCDDGTCIPLQKYKNHAKDCPDGTDEAYDCCPNQFLCDRKSGIGKCLPMDLLDNNVTDCIDQTDETVNNEKTCEVLDNRAKVQKIPSQSYYYTCQTVVNGSPVGKCVDMKLVLDGREDCPMSDDEDPANFDECLLKKSNCSVNAACINVPNGSFKCTCLTGFKGDGINCQKSYVTPASNREARDHHHHQNDGHRRQNVSNFGRIRSRTPVVFREPLALPAGNLLDTVETSPSHTVSVLNPAVGFYTLQEPLAFCCSPDSFYPVVNVNSGDRTLNTLAALTASSSGVCCSEFSQTLATRGNKFGGGSLGFQDNSSGLGQSGAESTVLIVENTSSSNVISSATGADGAGKGLSSENRQHAGLRSSSSFSRSTESLDCSTRPAKEEAGYSGIMLLYYFASAVKNAHFHVDDDIVDKLSYHYTGSIIIIFAILVSAKQFVGFPIQCWVPATFTEPMEQYTENFCWVQNTYWLQIHDYVPQNFAERDSRQIGYYQWVPFILALEALLFYLPCLAWRLLSAQSGIHVQSLVQMACDSRLLDKESRQKALDIISTHVEESLHIKHHIGAGTKFKLLNIFVCTRSAGSAVTCLYLSIKFLYGVNVASQILLLNTLLGNRDMMYGFHVLNDLMHSREWDESGNFPRVTLCDFEVKVLGNVHRHTVQCVLMINMFNEKVFLFLWFWYILLLIATICSLIYWIFITVLPGRRINFVNKYLVGLEGYRMVDSQSLRRFVFNFLRYDGVFLLRMTATHAGDLACCDLAKTLWNKFHDNKERAHDI